MGLIDDIGNALADLLDFLDLDPGETAEAVVNTNEPTEAAAILAESITPVDEIGSLFVDFSEEFILTPLEQKGTLTPDNIEGVVDQLDGNAAAQLGGVLVMTLALEAVTAGQFEETQSQVFQAIAGLGFTDVAGREIDARMQEGVDPALKQKVNRDHRSKQADFQDFVQGNRALRDSTSFIFSRAGLDRGDIPDYLNPDDFGWMPDPDTYGTIEEQTSLYELASLEVTEPEELIEEPVQYGIPVPNTAIKQVTELAGIPRDAANIYQSVIDQLPKNENLMRDYVRLTEFNFRLREKVGSGALTPEQARGLIEPELRDIIENALPEERLQDRDRDADEVVDILADELQRNFKLLSDLPADPPTQGDLEAWFQKGVLSIDGFYDGFTQFGGRPEDFALYYQEACIDQGWDGIQRAHTLGRISTSDAKQRLQRIGYTQQEAADILAGADGDSIVSARLSEEGGPTTLAPGSLRGIGDAREAALDLAGVETVAGVAELSVDQLTQITGMTDQEALTAIEQAQGAVEAGEAGG